LDSNQAFLLVQSLKSAPKGFTHRVKAENKKQFFLIYHFMAFTWPQGIKTIPFNLGGQFATLTVIVAKMKLLSF
jgi:hypothetical protein